MEKIIILIFVLAFFAFIVFVCYEAVSRYLAGRQEYGYKYRMKRKIPPRTTPPPTVRNGKDVPTNCGPL